MRIDDDLLHFCARKTSEIAKSYDGFCILPAEESGFPRSVDDLEVLVAGTYDKPIRLKQLPVPYQKAKYRSFYIPCADGCDIYFASGLPKEFLRYYKAKELLQIHLWLESLRTHDVVELVQNMILRAMPESLDLDLGRAATSDTLGDVAAMEFLFPCAERVKYRGMPRARDELTTIARTFDIPPFVVQRSFNVLDVLKPFFMPGEMPGKKKGSTDAEGAKRIREAAREHATSNDPASFERACRGRARSEAEEAGLGKEIARRVGGGLIAVIGGA
jgi:hypothetical protein